MSWVSKRLIFLLGPRFYTTRPILEQIRSDITLTIDNSIKLDRIIICDYVPYYPIALFFSFFLNAKLILRLRGDVYNELSEFPALLRLPIRWLCETAFRRATKLVTVSDNLASIVKLKNSNSVRIYNHMDFSRSAKPIQLRQRVIVVSTNFRFFKKCAAIIEYIDVILDISRNFDIRWEIYGTGKYRQKVERSCFEFGATEENICFRGKLENFREALGDKQYYIHISGLDSIPTSLLEAMAEGCLILAINKFGIPELVNEGQNGFLFDNKYELQKKFRYLEQRECLKKTLSKNALKCSTEQLNFKKIKKQWLDVLEL